MRSRGFGGLRGPAFVEIDEVRHCKNVVAISDAVLFFPLFQSRRERIAPSEFRCECIPDKEVALVQAPPVLKKPFENSFIVAPWVKTFGRFGTINAKQLDTGSFKFHVVPAV